jgi:hypothetical protein
MDFKTTVWNQKDFRAYLESLLSKCRGRCLDDEEDFDTVVDLLADHISRGVADLCDHCVENPQARGI